MVTAVLFDFYGTLAQATQWMSVDVVLAEHGYAVSDEVKDRWWNEGLDGVEHVEHSQSREHYQEWQRERLLAMLAEVDVHPGEYEEILQKLRQGTATRVLEAFPEVPEVLDVLRRGGLALGVCSNWDWELLEALGEVGLAEGFDVIVSSAWAGARKPHPRIFEHTLTKLGVPASETIFVGDTWGPDVVGPRSVGMTALYLRREDRWPDSAAPDDPAGSGVAVGADLTAVLALVEEAL
ncbi:MAG TPA: HAD family hydrolase [Acidimicrobiia bacterium]